MTTIDVTPYVSADEVRRYGSEGVVTDRRTDHLVVWHGYRVLRLPVPSTDPYNVFVRWVFATVEDVTADGWTTAVLAVMDDMTHLGVPADKVRMWAELLVDSSDLPVALPFVPTS